MVLLLRENGSAACFGKRPTDSVTCAEIAAMIVRAAGLSMAEADVSFTDAGAVSDWANN